MLGKNWFILKMVIMKWRHYVENNIVKLAKKVGVYGKEWFWINIYIKETLKERKL